MTRIAVLNPGGRDPTRLFPHLEGRVDDPGHPPVNYHAYAACVGGGFYRDDREIPSETAAVVVLLRRDLNTALVAIERLKKRGLRVWIAWKETGAHQVGHQLARPGAVSMFRTVCAAADGFLSSTPWLVPVYRASGCLRGKFVPTPYPVQSPAWDFSVPLAERSGIFIGTREFDVPTRNHLAAILLAADVASRRSCAVTVINENGREGRRILRCVCDCCPALKVVEGRRPYPEYLRLMAQHRVVFQLDRSMVPGQVAGDALLCRLPCVGGDSAVEQIAFPGCMGYGRSFEELTELLERLLNDDAAYEDAASRAQQAALKSLSFQAVAEDLAAML